MENVFLMVILCAFAGSFFGTALALLFFSRKPEESERRLRTPTREGEWLDYLSQKSVGKN